MNDSRSEAMRLIDEIDDLIHDARVVPLTDQVRIDRGQISELLDQLREAVAPPNSGPR